MTMTAHQPRNAAYGVALRNFTRLEIQQMVEVTEYNTTEDFDAHVEADVGQAPGTHGIPEDAIVTKPFFGLYARAADGIVTHIADYSTFEDAEEMVREMGGNHEIVPPGPSICCRGESVVFENDGCWPAREGDQATLIRLLCTNAFCDALVAHNHPLAQADPSLAFVRLEMLRTFGYPVMG